MTTSDPPAIKITRPSFPVTDDPASKIRSPAFPLVTDGVEIVKFVPL